MVVLVNLVHRQPHRAAIVEPVLREAHTHQLRHLLLLLALRHRRRRAHLHDLCDGHGTSAHLRSRLPAGQEHVLESGVVEGDAAQRQGAKRCARVPQLDPQLRVGAMLDADLEVLLEVDGVMVVPLARRRPHRPRGLHLVHAIEESHTQRWHPAVRGLENRRVLLPAEQARQAPPAAALALPSAAQEQAAGADAGGVACGLRVGLLGIHERGKPPVSPRAAGCGHRRRISDVDTPDAHLKCQLGFVVQLAAVRDQLHQREAFNAELVPELGPVAPQDAEQDQENTQLEPVLGVILPVWPVERIPQDRIGKAVDHVHHNDEEFLIVCGLDQHDQAQWEQRRPKPPPPDPWLSSAEEPRHGGARLALEAHIDEIQRSRCTQD
mmetsp:Transcript_133458/g.386290  ORF Transcript_133458/g.386290 Transcript_133458/m.386290 type:complete len:380 (+) Transcript_133458:149-1288(+)